MVSHGEGVQVQKEGGFQEARGGGGAGEVEGREREEERGGEAELGHGVVGDFARDEHSLKREERS